jgi:ATP-dependent Zn protease
MKPHFQIETAMHEAAHAVALIAMGHPVKEVTIISDSSALGKTFPADGYGVCATDEERAVVALAGLTIEAMISPKDIALRATAEDWIYVERLAAEKDAGWIDRQSEKAAKIAGDNFALIQRIAEELMQRGHLCGDEVSSLIEFPSIEAAKVGAVIPARTKRKDRP